jgi:hypothetical protein
MRWCQTSTSGRGRTRAVEYGLARLAVAAAVRGGCPRGVGWAADLEGAAGFLRARPMVTDPA